MPSIESTEEFQKLTEREAKNTRAIVSLLLTIGDKTDEALQNAKKLRSDESKAFMGIQYSLPVIGERDCLDAYEKEVESQDKFVRALQEFIARKDGELT